jgi:MraZ protein
VNSGEQIQGLTNEAVVAEPMRSHAVTGFCGTYHHQVDAKGRVAVPSQFRRLLPDGSVVSPAPDRRLMIWVPEQWERQQAMYRRTAETSAQERRFFRALVGNTYPLEADAQGRLLLSSWQRTWASISDRAVFVGLGDGVEIAGEETWSSQGGDLDPDEFTRLNDLVYQRSRGEHA